MLSRNGNVSRFQRRPLFHVYDKITYAYHAHIGFNNKSIEPCAASASEVTTSVCISGYPLSGYPDLSVNFTAAKNPDIIK